jgi:putative acetyltransferase
MTLHQSGKTDVEIRLESAADRQGVWNVNRAAFSTETEAKLVDALRDGGYSRVSLVAVAQNSIVGHILFSRLPVLTASAPVEALSLAPLAVLPEWQRQGIGSRLVREGLTVSQELGHTIVFVLGHPDFYPRLGFSADLARPVCSPFGAGDAWMAIELANDSLAGVTGRVEYPPPFDQLT